MRQAGGTGLSAAMKPKRASRSPESTAVTSVRVRVRVRLRLRLRG